MSFRSNQLKWSGFDGSTFQEYWAAYGEYFYTTYAPQSDVRLVILAFIIIVSIFYPVVQYQKYQRVCRFLTQAAVKGWGLHEGGTKEVRGLYEP